jgi:hypothetical protein
LEGRGGVPPHKHFCEAVACTDNFVGAFLSQNFWLQNIYVEFARDSLNKLSTRIFPLIQADKDWATEEARRIVDYYSNRRGQHGKKLGLDREHEKKLWYVGKCAESAIRRILNGRFGEGEEFGSDWDIFLPRIGYVQVKSTHIFGWNPFPVLEPRTGPNPEHLVWLTYYRDSDIQKVRELNWSEVLEYPKSGEDYQVPVAKEFWDQVSH